MIVLCTISMSGIVRRNCTIKGCKHVGILNGEINSISHSCTFCMVHHLLPKPTRNNYFNLISTSFPLHSSNACFTSIALSHCLFHFHHQLYSEILCMNMIHRRCPCMGVGTIPVLSQKLLLLIALSVSQTEFVVSCCH